MEDYTFQFKPFEEMTTEDYATVGFMSGLEVHQQLYTERKLFCRCPAGKYSNKQKYDAEILRHMRPTLSELGEYDGTALMEFKTKKDIVYRINRETVCTYEMDDTPPFEINDEALDKALGVGMLYNSNMVDEVHIARKQYLDGSIPTGFQRTAIFCVDGKIPYKNKDIDVVQISIEEDSCREISDIGHERTWSTDRLGMPLIETVTAPQMKTPFEVAEVCTIIRRSGRSTGWMRTGVGASREDVNVSVTGGTRIEIKGVPSIKKIPVLTYHEAMRQWNLLRLRKELKRRGITPETFAATTTDITKLLRKTHYQPIADAISNGKMVNCVLLKGFKDLLRWQTQTDTYFSKEISDRVRVVACLTVLPNIIHSDSASETFLSAEWREIRKAVNAASNDAFVIVWGNKQDVEMASNEIIIRAKEATIGIPSETRQALSDGTTGFERILPGPQRMYPDTDLPPKKITNERLAEIKAKLPAYWEREKWYRKLNIPEDVIVPLSISKYAQLFEYLVKEQQINPKVAAVVLVQFMKRLKREGFDVSILNEQMMREIFHLYKKGKLPREGILPAMRNIIKHKEFSKELVPSFCSEKETKNAVKEAKKELSGIKLYNPNNNEKIFIGLLMKKLRGRVDGANISFTVLNKSKQTVEEEKN